MSHQQLHYSTTNERGADIKDCSREDILIAKLLSRDEEIARLKQTANEHDKEITEKDKRIKEIEAKDSAKGFEITNSRDIVASRDQIVSFREAHIDRRRLVAEQISKNEDIRVKDKELQMKDEMIAAKEEEIAALGSICNNQGGNLLESEHEIASLKDKMTSRDEEITNLKQTLSLRLNVSERAITRLETNLKDKHSIDNEARSRTHELQYLSLKVLYRYKEQG